MTDQLDQTPLYDRHHEHGARMVPFSGWSMPLLYTSIVEEHRATRERVTLFDVSHMGRFQIRGAGAAAAIDRLVTRRVADCRIGEIRYSMITNHEGGVLDDLLVYRLAEDHVQLVVNAGNRLKLAEWITQQCGSEMEFEDQTLATAMIAVQGPQAVTTLTKIVAGDTDTLAPFRCRQMHVAGKPALVSRTGYTGEDGCELIVAATDAVGVWNAVLEAGAPAGAVPAGLGCRDTLRLEAAMPLYGHELSEQITPAQAGLPFAVNLENREFIGREAIRRALENPELPRRVGLALEGKRVPRQGYPVKDEGRTVGEVTSGTFSPTLARPIAIAYVQPSAAELGRQLQIDIRGRDEPAQVVKLPFYKRPK